MIYPKIGIRPVIDGRQFGVREDLEQQTMDMAYAAQKLIESRLRYPDGTKVQCVIAPKTIGGGAEAYECETFFQTQNVCATLSVTPCWCYGSETMDLNPLTIKAVWGFNGTERPEPFIWQPAWRLMHSVACRRLPFTAKTCRTSGSLTFRNPERFPKRKPTCRFRQM